MKLSAMTGFMTEESCNANVSITLLRLLSSKLPNIVTFSKLTLRYFAIFSARRKKQLIYLLVNSDGWVYFVRFAFIHISKRGG